LVGCQSKTLTASRQVGDLAEDLMANSMTSMTIKPTAAFNRDDTFVFGSWVCIAHSTGSFQHYLTTTPEPETGFMTLPEAATDQLVEKFDEISLYNNIADLEFGSTSNSNLTITWVEPRELAPEPSCGPILPHEQFPYGLRSASTAYTEALTPVEPTRRSPPSTPQAPVLSSTTTQTPPTSSTLDWIRSCPSPTTTWVPMLRSLCQVLLLLGHQVYSSW
jgi:hypothetical protein